MLLTRDISKVAHNFLHFKSNFYERINIEKIDRLTNGRSQVHLAISADRKRSVAIIGDNRFSSGIRNRSPMNICFCQLMVIIKGFAK